MATSKKITLPAKIIQPLPEKKIKFTTHPTPTKKSQFSQKSRPPPSQKNQLPKSPRSHKNIHVLRALYNILFV